MNEKWKYRIIGTTEKLSPEGLNAKLNECGEDGWELCGTIPTPVSLLLIFKKPKNKIQMFGNENQDC